ncbi:hypothetical protein C8R48DRAFT_678778 [Suillus tomentosus]|nr:hypothetical protein C8R48DRAFT_678778 [Suillus tomentosus]
MKSGDALSSRNQPSARALRGNLLAYEVQELQWGINASLISYERELQRSSDEDMYMGSAMDLDLPNSTGNGTYSCMDTLMMDDEVEPFAIVPITYRSSYQTPKTRNLIRGLHKSANKYIDRHCKKKHPITERLSERIYIALHTATLGIDVEDIVLPEVREQTIEVAKQSELPTDHLISPAIARRIFNGVMPKVKRGLQSLGAALIVKSSVPVGGYLTGYPATMPGEFAD